MARRGRRAEADAVLDAAPASILDFERFADGLGFLSEPERDRLKLAGDEVLDNIIRHANPVSRSRIRARAALRGGTILLGFYFRARDFAAFAAGELDAASAEPLYDAEHRRWRGLGLVMCRNLARKVSFRPGEMMDRIFLEFESHK